MPLKKDCFKVLKVALLLLLLNVKGHSQSIRFDYLDIYDGLSQNSAFCMDFDANGYLWVGTLNGLNRYDGYSFDIFKPSLKDRSGIKGSLCRAIGCDNRGNVWVATSDGGLNKFDFKRQNFIYYSDSLFKSISTKNIDDIKVDKDGIVWLKTPKKILAFNPKDSAVVEPIAMLSFDHLYRLKSGNVAIYGKSGMFEMLWNEKHNLNAKMRIDKPCRAISIEGNHLVALHDTCIAYYDCISYKKINFIMHPHINTLAKKTNYIPFVADSNKVWMGHNNGLSCFEEKDEKTIHRKFEYNANNPHSLHGVVVSKLLKDKAGNIWIGTQKHGVNYIGTQNNDFKHINWQRTDGRNIDIDLVRAICPTSDSEYWLGFDRNGLGIIDADGKQRYINTYLGADNKPQLLKGVRAVFEDNDKRIWVSMQQGVCIYNRKSKQLEHISRYLPNNWDGRSYCIKQFDSTRIAISAGNTLGIIDFDKRREEIYNFTDAKPYIASSIRDIIIDNTQIWLALDLSGLVHINTETKTISHYTPKSIDLSDTKIYSIKKIDNNLWIATNNGLNRFNTLTSKVEQVFYEEHGLSNNIVYLLNTDNEQNLWMATNRGICQLNTKTNVFSSFLESHFFMDDASYQTNDGTIYYGGYNGVIVFNPNEMSADTLSCDPHVNALKIHNQAISPGDTVNGRVILSKHINNAKSLSLSYFENTFSFSFNAMPYYLPNTNLYKYRLVNWQDEWVEGIDRSVTFTNVTPGKYQFLLSVSNNGKTWSAPKVIDINIEPPFWQTAWFKLISIGCFTLLLFVFYRWRVYRIKQRNKLLKETVEEQTKDIISKSNEIQEMAVKLHEADEAKLRFFTNISHEFRTPLTLILGYLDDLEASDSFRVKKIIKNNALRLLRMVNQLIEFRKLDKDQLKLEVSNFELNAFVSEITDSFQKLAKQKNIRLSFHPCQIKLPIWLDVDKTEKILFNLISNAIKYTPENKGIAVSIHDVNTSVEIKVSDEGIGISSDDLKHIFNRFYRSKNSQETGHGIGLSLAKGLTEVQFGTLSVESEHGKGSTFILSFIKGSDHFNAEDILTNVSPKQITNSIDDETDSIEVPKTISDQHILLVEDDDELSQFMIQILGNNYKVTRAIDGVDALTQLEEFIPDLIISDITMPRLDGINFCKKVKANAVLAHIPFVLLTAKTDSKTRIESYQLGIDDYVEKPFDKHVLLARVHALLAQKERQKNASIEIKTLANIDKSKLSKSDVQFWKKTNTLIQRSYKQTNFTTEVLSEKMNMSRSTFYRKFKSISGENAADYIRKIRLLKAAELIRKKDINIQQVSLEVGFQSTAHFRVKFKEYFGVNPSEFV